MCKLIQPKHIKTKHNDLSKNKNKTFNLKGNKYISLSYFLNEEYNSRTILYMISFNCFSSF